MEILKLHAGQNLGEAKRGFKNSIISSLRNSLWDLNACSDLMATDFSDLRDIDDIYKISSTFI